MAKQNQLTEEEASWIEQQRQIDIQFYKGQLALKREEEAKYVSGISLLRDTISHLKSSSKRVLDSEEYLYNGGFCIDNVTGDGGRTDAINEQLTTILESLESIKATAVEKDNEIWLEIQRIRAKLRSLGVFFA